MLPTDKYDVCSGLDQLIVIGINYHNADTATRGSFSVCEATYDRIATQATHHGVQDIFVLSTCNRTEVYGIGQSDLLTTLLCEATGNAVSTFRQHGYTLRGMDAVAHLFKVAAGLDSRILGDNEILMQLKKAAAIAKNKGMLGTLLDRLVNFSLQASKRIKTETRISSGTVSVAYAAIEVIRQKLGDTAQKNILLVGAGKFGRRVAKNINEYFPGATVRITNRTWQKALDFAQQYNLEPVPFDQLADAANACDVLITSTNTDHYSILPHFFVRQKPRLLLDLSVPKCIDPGVNRVSGITLMDVDEISAILDHTFAIRTAEVPKALSIIGETQAEFISWHKLFLHRHFLGEVKSKLYELSAWHGCPNSEIAKKEITDAKIQKAVKTLAVDLRTHTAKGCQFIHTINTYLQMNPS